jgi:signal peptidase I
MKKRRSAVRELLETALLTVVIFLVVRVALQNFKVEGQSMEPNLHNDEYILVNKVDYLVHSPQRGDIVVFKAVPAGQPDRDFIKRVIGVPGDTVSVHNDTVYVNGHALKETYISQPPTYTWPSSGRAEVVPKDEYFVLGDNRNNSFDSSKWPTPWLPKSDIIGKAWIAYWPPSDVGVFAGELKTALGL